MAKEYKEPHGGGIGFDKGTNIKLTWTCQHLYTSAVQPGAVGDADKISAETHK